ncbi:hypothetical protein ABZ532_28350 [Streptomyces sp. NPDC019396]|uniref:hypothetical protein n=1 Tax=Streptomyces sp. NPDC019396 TaxID=3154687 RepID=UPI0033C1A692
MSAITRACICAASLALALACAGPVLGADAATAAHSRALDSLTTAPSVQQSDNGWW